MIALGAALASESNRCCYIPTEAQGDDETRNMCLWALKALSLCAPLGCLGILSRAPGVRPIKSSPEPY